jgi:8-oxo-dGTP pyrophosphatase MutT (NUDIX family)
MLLNHEHIRAALALPLPGEEAHRKAMSYKRMTGVDARQQLQPRESAVVALLFPALGALNLLFIVRPGGDSVHSGQVAFPGGARDEADASLLDTALRELHEETGVEGHSVELIGELSEVYIPPSNFIVKPFVAYAERQPLFQPAPAEVQQLLTEPLDNLMRPDATRLRTTFMPKYNISLDIPSFDIQGHQLWGATAMMVMELREAIRAWAGLPG